MRVTKKMVTVRLFNVESKDKTFPKRACAIIQHSTLKAQGAAASAPAAPASAPAAAAAAPASAASSPATAATAPDKFDEEAFVNEMFGE